MMNNSDAYIKLQSTSYFCLRTRVVSGIDRRRPLPGDSVLEEATRLRDDIIVQFGFASYRFEQFEPVNGDSQRCHQRNRCARSATDFPQRSVFDIASRKHVTRPLVLNVTIFQATELINNELPGDFAEETVTIVITDVDDQIPEFNHPRFEINVPENVELDYETQKSYSLSLEAKDGGGKVSTVSILVSLTDVNDNAPVWESPQYQRTVREGATSFQPQFFVRLIMGSVPDVQVIIDVGDVNDNKPVFSMTEYSAVVLENVRQGTSVVNVTATDLDTGPGGTVEYEIVLDSEAAGLFMINRTTGEIVTRTALTGKGRTDPYSITVRAQDEGEPSLFSDVAINIIIGDVVANDGIPVFLHPTIDEMAYISENSSIGSPVFRAIASDPDDPNSLEGQIRYSFLNDGMDSLAFKIDAITGLITTNDYLDREVKSNYSVILIAQDSGMVPQHTTRQLRISVTDIDDNKPVFKRAIEDPPIEFTAIEESPSGTMVGIVSAVDIDVGENAKIDYLITYGNEDNLFSLTRLDNNSAMLNVSGRIDRESYAHHVITVKCFKASTRPLGLRKIYNKYDLSEIQIIIKVIDTDDNLPSFIKHNTTVGVRTNVAVDSLLHTIQAIDEDVDAAPIFYDIESIQYTPPSGVVHRQFPVNVSLFNLFTLDNKTGELRHPQLSRLLNSALQGRANQQQLQQQLLQQQLNQQLFGQQLSGRQQLNQLLGQQQLSQQQLNQQQLSQLLGQQQLSQLLGQQQLSPQQLGQLLGQQQSNQLLGQQQSNQLLGQQQSNQLLGSDDASADAALRCGRGGRGRGWGFNPFFGLGGLGGFGGVPFRGGGFGRFRSSDVQQLLSAPMSLRQRIALQIRQQLQQVNQRLGQAGLQNEQMSDQFVSELVDKVGQGSPEEVQLYLKRLQQNRGGLASTATRENFPRNFPHELWRRTTKNQRNDEWKVLYVTSRLKQETNLVCKFRGV
ncbi:unnamed protein product [Nesidiocoris tenuis]|uniref:Cadherin domain-containing protein n=1 Tax=Nesidiocoris tenuis TaxID=355587 RepID=A0A6H5HAU8_9HEMI|nr:unnamed protein product [Nesidiocoris tenuis]